MLGDNLFLGISTSIMFKWFKELFTRWNEVQKELNQMGIFTAHSHMTAWTHVDEEQFKKYLNDRQKAIPKDN